jgi:hypothetical protein
MRITIDRVRLHVQAAGMSTERIDPIVRQALSQLHSRLAVEFPTGSAGRRVVPRVVIPAVHLKSQHPSNDAVAVALATALHRAMGGPQ